MKMSQMFGVTLRQAPGTTDATGHKLLLRAGFIRQLGQGIFSTLPLALRSIRKIEAILREEMNAVGGQEVSMPVVHPAEAWKATGRYWSVGPEMVRFKDRRDREMVLAMTHEEIVAQLCDSDIASYRQLPRLVYQIQTKFRDDPRPRAGLIRVREFTMKDAYSLDLDDAGLDVQYRRQYDAYLRIFARCGLRVRVVGSDVGMMGGKEAHEFMYLTPIGEDSLVFCDSCGYSANRQIAAFAKPGVEPEESGVLTPVETPGASTIDALAAFLDIPASRTAKAMFMAADVEGENGITVRPIVALVRGDMDLNETKLANAVGVAALRPMAEDEIKAIGAVAGYGSPVGVTNEVTVVADDLVAASPNLVIGANREGWHLRNGNVGRDFAASIVADIAAVQQGDPCATCGSPLDVSRGVEVGNIFKLGSRYTEAVGARYLDHEGQLQPIVMGSYGIGVGRLLACIAEEHNDDNGLRWPISVAPFAVHICSLTSTGPDVEGQSSVIYDMLSAAGIDSLYDDRAERPGVQFSDADLIGLPLRVTVSTKLIAAGVVELKKRTEADAERVPLGDLAQRISSLVTEMTKDIFDGSRAAHA